MSDDPSRALSRFLGQGSAHEGAHHWRAQRLTALALIPLTLWFVWTVVSLPDYEFLTLRGWVAVPWHALLLALLIGALSWHSQLGVQVVIEDYVYGTVTKPAALLFNAFAHVLIAAAGIFAVISAALNSGLRIVVSGGG